VDGVHVHEEDVVPCNTELRYQEKEYGALPPVPPAVKLTDWLTSAVLREAVKEGMPRGVMSVWKRHQ
jgi:hypothetical protein